MKKIIAFLCLFPLLAWGQSSPNWPIGYQPTAAEWNAEWASKQDYAQTGIGIFTTLTVANGGSLSGTFGGSPVFSGSVGIGGSLTVGSDFTLNGALNISSSLGYQQNGHTILNVFGAGDGTGQTTLVGYGAGAHLPPTDTETSAFGYNCLNAATISGENSCFGWATMRSMTTGTFNSGFGVNVMGLMTTDTANSIFGVDGMRDSTGSSNVGVGDTIWRDGHHQRSVAIGSKAIQANGLSASNTDLNVCVGYQCMAGPSLSTASNNTIVGANGFQNASSGIGNTMMGLNVGLNAAGTINGNILIGGFAGLVLTGNSNILIGNSAGEAQTSGPGNIYLGNANNSGSKGWVTTGGSNICIGDDCRVASVTANNQISVGNMLFMNNNSLGAPGLTSCGTGATLDAHANNKSGMVTPGTGSPSGCVVTLAGAGYPSWSHVRVTPHSTVSGFGYSYAGGIITVTSSGVVPVFDYDTDGQ